MFIFVSTREPLVIKERERERGGKENTCYKKKIVNTILNEFVIERSSRRRWWRRFYVSLIGRVHSLGAQKYRSKSVTHNKTIDHLRSTEPEGVRKKKKTTQNIASPSLYYKTTLQQLVDCYAQIGGEIRFSVQSQDNRTLYIHCSQFTCIIPYFSLAILLVLCIF